MLGNLLLATLNPARKRKRRMGRHKRGCACVVCGHKARRVRHGGSRRLSAWQRMVKRYGGVMEALKHRKKKSGTVRRRGRSRRRIRTNSSRRHTMARVRSRRKSRRRHVARNRGGRFVRRGRSRRARRNPLWRARRSGQYKGRAPGRRLHRYRSGGWHNPRRRRHARRNAVVPVSWNPSRRRRHARRNGVLPVSWNPAGVLGGVMGRVGKFVDLSFWTDTALPAAGGFVGSKVVGGMIYGAVWSTVESVIGAKAAPFVRIAANAVGGAVASYVLGRMIFRSKRIEEGLWIGTVVSVAHSILKELLGGTDIGRTIGLDGLGDGVSDRMREAVAARVARDLSGFGTYMTRDSLQRQGVGEYANLTALRRQPGFAPTPAADLKDYEVNSTETRF